MKALHPNGSVVRLYTAGRLILMAALRELLEHGLKNATAVMLTGDSAGGLAVFHAADPVAEFLRKSVPTLQTFKGVVVSGFFLNHTDVTGAPAYADALGTAVRFHGSLNGGVDPACVAANGNNPTMCFLAEHAIRTVKTPLFMLQSAMDYYQTLCILTGKVMSTGCTAIKGWEACRADLNQCSATQMEAMVRFERDFIRKFGASMAAASAEAGAFLYSCHNHVAGGSPLFTRILVGGDDMSTALSGWWDGRRGKAYTSPCIWSSNGPIRRCNPTCLKPGEQRAGVYTTNIYPSI